MTEVLMKAPDGTVSASVAGVEYKVSEQGTIRASLNHFSHLIDHGFKQIAELIDEGENDLKKIMGDDGLGAPVTQEPAAPAAPAEPKKRGAPSKDERAQRLENAADSKPGQSGE